VEWGWGTVKKRREERRGEEKREGKGRMKE
jgi:hypothetical protein